MAMPHRQAGRTLIYASGSALLFGVALLPARAQTAPAAAPRSEAARQPEKEARKDEWMGMYLDKDRIGYQHVHVEPTTWQGKPALRITTQGVTKLTLFGTSVEETESSETVTDAKYQPLTQILDVKSNGSAIHLQAIFDYARRSIACRIGTCSDVTRKTIAIPPGANLAADTSLLTEGQKLTVGKKLTFYYLNPLTVDLQQATLEVTGRETIKHPITGKDVTALVTKAALPVGESTEWDTEEGDTLKSEVAIAGLRITSMKETRESAEAALGALAPTGKTYTPPADFALATAVQADKPIANPRSLKHLDVTVAGVPNKRYVLSDARQKAAEETSQAGERGLRVNMQINAANPRPASAASLPVTGGDFAPYLNKTAYLDTEEADIRRTAKQVRGQETNLYRVALKLRNWVHAQMTPDLSIGVPRTATDIFHRPRGVCRDYATLYTALARAAGVPTRLCSGIVYAEGKDGESGRFFYHAWAESWVGQWIAVDPTLYDPTHPLDYVDATHIKFAQGDVIGMFDVVGVIGKLRVIVHDAS